MLTRKYLKRTLRGPDDSTEGLLRNIPFTKIFIPLCKQYATQFLLSYFSCSNFLISLIEQLLLCEMFDLLLLFLVLLSLSCFHFFCPHLTPHFLENIVSKISFTSSSFQFKVKVSHMEVYAIFRNTS